MRGLLFGYFKASLVATIAGLSAAFWLGWATFGSLGGALSFLFIGAVLATLEISLSFDNAIVNANKLQTMQKKWQRRFLTWGILIAVFGMRLIFPLAVVVVAAGIGPLAAIKLAAVDPPEYARLMAGAQLGIAAFGGTFLLMVALNYFVDANKKVDWFEPLEVWLRSWASIRGLATGIVSMVIIAFSLALEPGEQAEFLLAAVSGLFVFFAVEFFGNILDTTDRPGGLAQRGGLGAFLYLETLDASFSFDGVIGAFALTQNLFLIAIGLSIGAMYVRSMTIMLVERKTLAHFRYLEHGAFYSILVLSLVMFLQTLLHVHELVTGLLGASLIAWSLWASVAYNRRSA